MFPLFKSMLLFTLCTSTLSRPLAAPATVHVPRAYSPNDPDLPPAVQTVCQGGVNATTVANSSTFAAGVVLTTGACAPSNSGSDTATIDAVPAVRPVCATAANNCQSRFGNQFSGNGYVAKCGAPCDSTCYPGTNGPDPNDCEHIISSLYAQSPQLFTLSQNNYLLLTYQTCGIGFQNQIAASTIGCSQQIIYDYTDVAQISHYLAWNCQGAQNARGGTCRARGGTYQPSVPDFYVQVYRN